MQEENGLRFSGKADAERQSRPLLWRKRKGSGRLNEEDNSCAHGSDKNRSDCHNMYLGNTAEYDHHEAVRKGVFNGDRKTLNMHIDYGNESDGNSEEENLLKSLQEIALEYIIKEDMPADISGLPTAEDIKDSRAMNPSNGHHNQIHSKVTEGLPELLDEKRVVKKKKEDSTRPIPEPTIGEPPPAVDNMKKLEEIKSKGGSSTILQKRRKRKGFAVFTKEEKNIPKSIIAILRKSLKKKRQRLFEKILSKSTYIIDQDECKAYIRQIYKVKYHKKKPAEVLKTISTEEIGKKYLVGLYTVLIKKVKKNKLTHLPFANEQVYINWMEREIASLKKCL